MLCDSYLLEDFQSDIEALSKDVYRVLEGKSPLLKIK